MSRHKFELFVVVLLLLNGVGGYFYSRWLDAQYQTPAAASGNGPASIDGNVPVRIAPEARKNLGLVSKPVQPQTYWRKIVVPGVITDRPGISDRGVVAPVTGIVTKIHRYPGDTVPPNSPLFSLRLVSESLHASQLELFKATKEIEIALQQRQRLDGLTTDGAIPKSRIIEIDNQIKRMEVNVQAYRQDLASRGLPPDRIEAAAKGEFVTEIVVRAPDETPLKVADVTLTAANDAEPKKLFNFELHQLKVELGQQVEAGTVLCLLADHRALMIEGQGFKKDLPLLQKAAREHYPIQVAFEVSESGDWPPVPRELQIHHVANLIDTESRTFAFFLPVENQFQSYMQNGEQRLVWRFRPGDRVRLSVAVDKIDNVFVLPQAALVREGPEAFVFRQNGDLFDRIAVHLLHEDSDSVVVASDGALKPNFYVAQNSAASLNRVLKAQLASGVPANLHVHADGTVHGAH